MGLVLVRRIFHALTIAVVEAATATAYDRIETAEKAIRRFFKRLGGPKGLAVCYDRGGCTIRCADLRRRFQFTPTHASWLNQVEIFFSILHERLLKHGAFTSEQSRAERILVFIEI